MKLYNWLIQRITLCHPPFSCWQMKDRFYSYVEANLLNFGSVSLTNGAMLPVQILCISTCIAKTRIVLLPLNCQLTMNVTISKGCEARRRHRRRIIIVSWRSRIPLVIARKKQPAYCNSSKPCGSRMWIYDHWVCNRPPRTILRRTLRPAATNQDFFHHMNIVYMRLITAQINENW